MSGYKLIILKDLLEYHGEDKAKEVLSSFSSLPGKGKDVQEFLHNKAIEFENRELATTYLIFASYKNKMLLAGYFTLANKSLILNKKAVKNKASKGSASGISNNLLRKLKPYSKYMKEVDLYIINAPLIGQLGKNYAINQGKLIKGDELLKIACDKVWEIQRHFSGRFVYLECEDNDKLRDFYSSNGFVVFGKRFLDPDERDDFSGNYLLQMIKDLKSHNARSSE